MKETYSKKTVNRTLKIARRLHSDISGKLPTSLHGYNYFLIVIDDASRCGWQRLLKNKSTAECLPAIKEIVTHIQLVTGEKVAFFTADNGSGEFGQLWKDWCRNLGIEVQPSPRYKHSLNGVAERAIGFLVQLAKSMIFHAQLNWKTCWGFAIEHAMYIRNRLPASALPYGPENTRPGSNITPVTVFSDKMISIQSNTIWILLIRKTGTELRSVDCEFIEHVFPSLLIQDSTADTSSKQVIEISRKTLGPYHKQEYNNNRVNGNSGRAQIDYNRVDGDSDLKLQNERVDRNSGFQQNKLNQVDKGSDLKLQNHKSRVSGDSGLDINVQNCDKEANKLASFLNNPNIQMVTRSGKVARLNPSNQSKKAFGNNSALMVKAINALNIDHIEESTSLGAPAIPFESPTLKQAFAENEAVWTNSLLDE
ncbi:hypothetical protein OnM2_081035 [Erysiphe neolycopersici]|uniref:Integrase catalytic domain-containing protein n=1 Tax=Erysiphe neolycopersici TaxID=212602 RepID=A0A420HG89_9PEZI|nr:hypothetical protein OnM2_081035 [Erysiphe neolycopersici]